VHFRLLTSYTSDALKSLLVIERTPEPEPEPELPVPAEPARAASVDDDNLTPEQNIKIEEMKQKFQVSKARF